MIIQVLIGGLMLGGIYALIALGYSLIYKASGLLTFVQGEFFMLGAFLGLTFYEFWKIPFMVSFFIVTIIMFFFGFMIEKIIITPMLEKKAKKIYIVLATIGLSITLRNVAMLIWGSTNLYFPPIFNVGILDIHGYKVAPEALLIIVISLFTMSALHFFMNRTSLGISMKAAAQNELAAKALGINVSFTRGITWGLSAALSSIGGILFAPMFSAYVTMGVFPGLMGFASAIVGGYGNMYGAMIGGLLMGFIQTFSGAFISSLFKNFIGFVILILVLFIKPSGILNEEAVED